MFFFFFFKEAKIVSLELKQTPFLKEGRKEMFYLRLCGVTHMVKDHSDSEIAETRCATWATLSD